MGTEVCPPGYIVWIYKVFGDCVVTVRDKVSFSIGMVSNCLWLVCSVPQIWHNYKTKSVDGISPFYFLLILTADLLSLFGAIATKALATQIVTGCIYVTLDCILLTQFVLYTCAKRRQKEPKESEQVDSAPLLPAFPVMVGVANSAGLQANSKEVWGTVSGWIGTGIYVVSRIFQLKKNCERKVITDLSPFYVTILIMANATYATSVFIKSVAREYLIKQLPWIVGSLVPMTFDCITAIQMCIYGYGQPRLLANKEAEKEK